jgi:hypothetical protein
MIIDFKYKGKKKGFSKHENEALIHIFIELNNIENQTESLSTFEIFQNECKLIDIIKKSMNIYKKNILSNFILKLRVKEVDKRCILITE